jgi:2-keto-4-pentenoate hydratase
MIDPRQVADALVAAERECKPIAPLTDVYPFLDADRAYQAQRLFVEDRLNRGDQVIGAKLGMTSKVMRTMLGVDQPVSGWLTAGMVLPYGRPVPLSQLIHPQAEPEIAIVLGRGSRACTVAEVGDLGLIGCVFSSQGEVVGTAAGAAVMGHPAAAVAWLVNTLAERGEHLRTGSVVLTGGLTAPAAVRQGRTLTAEFDQLGSVEVYA